MFKILSKEELEYTKIFNKYLNLCACPTDFAIGSGVLPFSNTNNLLCSNYYIEDTSFLDESKVMIADIDGYYNYTSKRDKYYTGLRIAINVKDIDDRLIHSKNIVNSEISVFEYGYFPKELIKGEVKKENTGIFIKLPISKSAFDKVEYKEFKVFKDKDIYYIEYRINRLITEISNTTFYQDNIAKFRIEPIRFWVDNLSGIMISQDIVLGGVPYRMLNRGENYDIDDYYVSDVFDALNIIEKDIETLNNLINPKEKKKVKK